LAATNDAPRNVANPIANILNDVLGFFD